jgi:hypothetical protein
MWVWFMALKHEPNPFYPWFFTSTMDIYMYRGRSCCQGILPWDLRVEDQVQAKCFERRTYPTSQPR